MEMIRSVLSRELASLEDVYGFRYSVIVECANMGGCVEVNVGEFDDFNVSDMMRVCRGVRFGEDYYIDTVHFSVQAKQLKIEVRRGQQEPVIQWGSAEEDQRVRGFQQDIEMNEGMLKGFLKTFASNQRLEAHDFYQACTRHVGRGNIIGLRVASKPEIYEVSMSLSQAAVLDSKALVYFGSKFDTCLLYTDSSPRMVIHMPRRTKDIIC